MKESEVALAGELPTLVAMARPWSRSVWVRLPPGTLGVGVNPDVVGAVEGTWLLVEGANGSDDGWVVATVWVGDEMCEARLPADAELQVQARGQY